MTLPNHGSVLIVPPHTIKGSFSQNLLQFKVGDRAGLSKLVGVSVECQCTVSVVSVFCEYSVVYNNPNPSDGRALIAWPTSLSSAVWAFLAHVQPIALLQFALSSTSRSSMAKTSAIWVPHA